MEAHLASNWQVVCRAESVFDGQNGSNDLPAIREKLFHEVAARHGGLEIGEFAIPANQITELAIVEDPHMDMLASLLPIDIHWPSPLKKRERSRSPSP